MSIEAMTWTYAHSSSTGPTRAVMLVVADTVNAKHGYRFWMTRTELASRAGLGERTVQRALAALVDAGELVRLSSGRPGKCAEYSFTEEVLGLLTVYALTTRQRGPTSPQRGPSRPALGVREARLTTTEPLYKPSRMLSQNENAEKAREIRANR